ncbi:hypothetical protein H7U32_02140 [Bifidobacterium pullorum subsp. saeculare]|uniref:Glycosyltransferase n=1 Tax=Bifidobacterium pullorum subsp. saeculare TaxID=78257 RepID=A0A938WWI5_9BIFI|nr:hypothetical protein [Bifidobacterium pullorum subsp. saeculare]
MGPLALAAAVLLALLMETVVFNLPFWRTVGASTDSAAPYNTLGTGLERTAEGLLRVTDPTRAYLELTADGTSGYARIDPVSDDQLRRANEAADRAAKALEEALEADPAQATTMKPVKRPVSTVHVRVDVGSAHGRAQSACAGAPRSLYLKASGAGTMRVWIEEPAGAVVPVEAVRANVRVPFSISVPRLLAMALAIAAVAALRPGSRLWRVRLDTRRRGQRLAFAAVFSLLGVATLAAVYLTCRWAGPMVFHKPGEYTYDFDQYGHLGDAILAGHPWLDLPVPDGLAAAADPHDVPTRNRLLAQGETLYWDYAFRDGHWYSYFGVLPALLLFAPYRAITSLFVDGGLMMPAAAAVQIEMFLFALFGSLLVVRLVRRLMPRASLAATVIALAAFLLGANAPYLIYRQNFYTVPVAASLALTVAGLWLWMGADTSRPPMAARDRWQVDGARPLSLPRLAGGALCIAATMACRPTFALAALLAFPLFWTQIRAMLRGLAAGRVPWLHALVAPAAMLAPALAVAVPQMLYNRARFGSPFDFGETYQMTVTDMTRFSLPAANVPVMVAEYLVTPLRLTPYFPWIGISPTPLPEWGYAETVMGGIFFVCPFLALALATPFLRRRLIRGTDGAEDPAPWRWSLPTAALALALALVVFDSLRGGLGWRYMADFGYLFAIAAMPALLLLTGGVPGPDSPSSGRRTLAWLRPLGRALVRWAVVLLLLAWVVLTVLMCFAPGRSDEMLGNNPALYHAVASWFTLL